MWRYAYPYNIQATNPLQIQPDHSGAIWCDPTSSIEFEPVQGMSASASAPVDMLCKCNHVVCVSVGSRNDCTRRGVCEREKLKMRCGDMS